MFYTLLAKLDSYLYPLNQQMKHIIETEGIDYSKYCTESKQTIAVAVSTTKSIKTVLDTTILSESRDLTAESESLVNEAIS